MKYEFFEIIFCCFITNFNFFLISPGFLSSNFDPDWPSPDQLEKKTGMLILYLYFYTSFLKIVRLKCVNEQKTRLVLYY